MVVRCCLGLICLASSPPGAVHLGPKLHRQLAALEQQHAIEKERARIAKDMHDDLGANLTQICILGELTRREADQPKRVLAHVDAISDTARELVQSMDEIVWSANPRNDNLRKLAGYIFNTRKSFWLPPPFAVASTIRSPCRNVPSAPKCVTIFSSWSRKP